MSIYIKKTIDPWLLQCGWICSNSHTSFLDSNSWDLGVLPLLCGKIFSIWCEPNWWSAVQESVNALWLSTGGFWHTPNIRWPDIFDWLLRSINHCCALEHQNQLSTTLEFQMLVLLYSDQKSILKETEHGMRAMWFS